MNICLLLFLVTQRILGLKIKRIASVDGDRLVPDAGDIGRPAVLKSWNRESRMEHEDHVVGGLMQSSPAAVVSQIPNKALNPDFSGALHRLISSKAPFEPVVHDHLKNWNAWEEGLDWLDNPDLSPELDVNTYFPLVVACGHPSSEELISGLIEWDHQERLLTRRNQLQLDTARDDGVTPILEAAKLGNAQVVKILVQAGANPMIPEGRPLLEAIQVGPETVSSLLAPPSPLYFAILDGVQSVEDVKYRIQVMHQAMLFSQGSTENRLRVLDMLVYHDFNEFARFYSSVLLLLTPLCLLVLLLMHLFFQYKSCELALVSHPMSSHMMASDCPVSGLPYLVLFEPSDTLLNRSPATQKFDLIRVFLKCAGGLSCSVCSWMIYTRPDGGSVTPSDSCSDSEDPTKDRKAEKFEQLVSLGLAIDQIEIVGRLLATGLVLAWFFGWAGRKAEALILALLILMHSICGVLVAVAPDLVYLQEEFGCVSLPSSDPSLAGYIDSQKRALLWGRRRFTQRKPSRQTKLDVAQGQALVEVEHWRRTVFCSDAPWEALSNIRLSDVISTSCLFMVKSFLGLLMATHGLAVASRVYAMIYSVDSTKASSFAEQVVSAYGESHDALRRIAYVIELLWIGLAGERLYALSQLLNLTAAYALVNERLLKQFREGFPHEYFSQQGPLGVQEWVQQRDKIASSFVKKCAILSPAITYVAFSSFFMGLLSLSADVAWLGGHCIFWPEGLAIVHVISVILMSAVGYLSFRCVMAETEWDLIQKIGHAKEVPPRKFAVGDGISLRMFGISWGSRMFFGTVVIFILVVIVIRVVTIICTDYLRVAALM